MDIRSPHLMKGQEINLDDLKLFLREDKDIAPLLNKIRIEENKGIVTLNGKVDSFDLKSKIENKIKMFSGVTKVVNNLETR